MNYEAIRKISSKNVINLCNEIPKADATKQFLILTNHMIEAFLTKSTSISDRIYYVWHSLFFIRIWRQWLKKNKYSIEKNCITSNTYTCIELNAHGLLLMLEKCREKNRIDIFLPWLFSSQACEKIFRQTRSMTTTYCTMVNYSFYDMIKRLNRIQALNEISTDLGRKKLFIST